MPTNDNLARQYQENYSKLPDRPKIDVKPGQEASDMKHSLVRPGLTKLEKLVMTLFAVAFMGLSLFSISMTSSLTAVSQEVQDLQQEIEETSEMNTNLEQNIQELSRYDRVYGQVRDQGLENQNDRVRKVE